MSELLIRKKIRLTGYDYAHKGYYFVTICTKNRAGIFVVNGLDRSARKVGNLKLSLSGEIAKEELLKISAHFHGVIVDKYCIMPNHVHMILQIGCNCEKERSRPFPTVSTIIGLYKSGVSKRIHERKPWLQIWQKSFHDHIIRNEYDYKEIWRYIDENPYNWEKDCFYVISYDENDTKKGTIKINE